MEFPSQPTACIADDLLKALRPLGRRQRQRCLPDALVVHQPVPPRFDFDLLVGERLAPEVDPHVVHKQEDQLVMPLNGTPAASRCPSSCTSVARFVSEA